MRPAVFQVGGTLYWTILTRDPDTLVAKDADSTPSVSVTRNNTPSADSVTVTKRSATTGIYDCSYNPAAETEGETFHFLETATVTGTTTSSATYPFGWVARCVAVERGTDSANMTTPPTVEAIADAVWDEARSGHVTAGTFGENVVAELDSASRLAIWNTLTTETFTADSFGELLLISDGTNGRAVKVTGANHIAADVHDCQADGLSGSTEIANIQDAAGWLLAIGSGAVANPQTSTEQYDITQFGVNYRVAMAGLTSTGTRTAPTLSKP